MKISNFAKSFYFTIKTPLKPSSSLSRFFCKHSSTSDTPPSLKKKKMVTFSDEWTNNPGSPDLCVKIKKDMSRHRFNIGRVIDLLQSRLEVLKSEPDQVTDMKEWTEADEIDNLVKRLSLEVNEIDRFYLDAKDSKKV